MSAVWYICRICNTRCFRFLKDLQAHQRTNHPDEEIEEGEEEDHFNETASTKNCDDDDKSNNNRPDSTSGPQDDLKSFRQVREGSVTSNVSTCSTVRVDLPSKGSKSRPTKLKSVSRSSADVPLAPTGSQKLLKESTATEQETFTCVFCRDWYPAEILLREHVMLVHGIDSTYKCLYCPKTYLNRTNRDDHENVEHKKMKNQSPLAEDQGKQRKLYKCKKCSIDFIDQLQLLLHNKTHPKNPSVKKRNDKEKNGVEIQKMKSPLKRLTSPKKKRSLPEKKEKLIYRCGDCESKFKGQKQLTKHLKTSGHSSKKPRKKGQVEEVKGQKERIKEAIEEQVLVPEDGVTSTEKNITEQVYKGRKIFVCDFCCKINSNRITALDHMREHTGQVLSPLYMW